MVTFSAYDAIKHVGYKGPLLDESEFKRALDGGPKNIEYTKLVSYLANEIKFLCSLDEHVNPITSPEDSVAFVMEVGSFLSELGCFHKSLTQGHTSDRLANVADCELLLEFLASELMAVRVTREKQPSEKGIELKLKESEPAADLRKILQTLGFPKPPPNITVDALTKRLQTTLENLVKKHGSALVGTALFNGNLSEKEWELVASMQQKMHDEYRIRREMLLTRLDCTVESFQWSNIIKGKEEQFRKVFSEKRGLLKEEPNVSLANLLAARSDLAIIEKTSSASVRKNTRSSLNSVIIGQVPDRGGRAFEQQPPPPEMPPWQQRSAGPSDGGRGGGGRGGFRGGYQRGGGQQQQKKDGGFGGGGDRGGGYGGGSNRTDYSSGSGGYGGNNRDSYSSGGGGATRNDSYGNYASSGKAGGNRYDNSQFSQGGNQSSRSDYSGNGTYSGNSRDSYGGGNKDSYGSYSSSGRGGGNRYDNQSSYGGNQSSYGGNQSSYGGNQSSYDRHSAGSYQTSFDSAGTYTSSYQEPKRVKTYDDFQSQQSRSTYADQYVQESQHNSQYNSRSGNDYQGNRNGGGRSNYNRGGSAGGRGGGGASYRRGGGGRGYH